MGKFYLLRGKAAAGVLTGLFGLTAALCFDPILMPMAVVPLYFAAPVFLAFAAVYAGLLPGAACLILACLGWWKMLGPAGAACALLYYVPVLTVFFFLTVKRPSGRLLPAAALSSAAALSQLILYLIVQSHFGGQAFQAFADAVADGIRGSEAGDSLLYLLNMSGLLDLSITVENAVTNVDGRYVLSEAVRENLLGSLRLYLETYLRVLVPSLVVGNGIYQGALISAFPLGWGRRLSPRLQAEKPLPESIMPPFRDWFLPRGHGVPFALMGAAGFICLRIGNPALEELGVILFQVFTTVYTIQALAVVNHRQWLKERHTWWRVLLPVLLLWFLSNLIWILGLIDQAVDFRKLRGPADTAVNSDKEG
ncbi:MAG: hypothetical protein IJR97_05775 [Clostridia bacterium]|nr:hypothetical protein [Clostridia bacterium]